MILIRRNLFSGLIGNILEYYNTTLYGFLTFHLTPLFLPDVQDMELQRLISLGAFTVAFLARPFGALILGALGDIVGRKHALGVAILLAALPSFIIAFLPSYEVIGLWAPTLLILARVLQGISIGGEYGNAVAFVLADAPLDKQNFIGSLLCASGFVGGLIAAIFAGFFTLDIFPDFFWRVPFFIGGCFALFGYYLRTNIPECKKIKIKTKIVTPIKHIILLEKIPFLRTVGVGIASSAPFYVASIYLNGLYTHHLTLATHSLMLLNVAYLGLWLFLLPFFGRLADKITNQKLMTLSGALIMMAGVCSFGLLHTISFTSLLLTQGLITLCSVGFLAPTNTYLRNLFSENTRSSGISLGYTIGGVIMGGTSPLLVEFLSHYTTMPIGFYLIGVGFCGFISISLKNKESVAPVLRPF